MYKIKKLNKFLFSFKYSKVFDQNRRDFINDDKQRQSIDSTYFTEETPIEMLYKTKSEVANIEMYDDLPVEIKGSKVPEPISSFDSKFTHKIIQNNLKK